MNAISVSNPARCYAPPLPRSRTNPGKNGRVSFAGFRSPRCALNVSIGGENYNYENIPKFTRMNVWDPYKRLGVTRDASEEEIRGARNFLLQQYAGHERSMESIEDAYEKIIMKSFRERKKTKINLKSRLKQKVEESPSWVKTLLSYVELPPADVILRRLFLFGFMGGWSIMTSAETGPAFQVALSLLSCIYFLNDKMNSVLRASATGFGALVVGWIVGSVLVPVIPSAILPPTWTLELLTSLVQFSLISVTLMTYSFDSVDKNAAVTLVFLVFLDFLLALAIMYV